MKLTELKPKWVGLVGWSSEHPFYIGVTFDCPHCRTQRLAVLFDPPIDPANLRKTMSAEPLGNQNKWQRTGDTFDNLTLTPSVDTGFAGHWHGFITGGEVSK